MQVSPAPWNPWAELAHRAHLRVVWVERGRRGCIDFTTREIRLRRTMPGHERRCVLAHELVHDERGPVPRWLTAREEAAVGQEAARRLIALDDLVRALQWSPFLTEVADELGVDVPTLRARLAGLTRAERDLLDDMIRAAAPDVDASDVEAPTRTGQEPTGS